VTVVLLHDLGDVAGGARWRAVAPADWVIPDLPGHGGTPAVRSGHYDPMAVVTLGRWAIEDPARATVVGIGQNADAALLLAAGDACARVVIVDGLWGVIPSAEGAMDQVYARIRALVDDPEATAPPPSSGLDPRATHGFGVTISTSFLQRFWAGVEIPVLAVETPASVTPAGERPDRLSWFAGPVDLAEVADDPVGVVSAVQAWQ
jgi:pimeloyl-ACP methyl ester carboxylesterase